MHKQLAMSGNAAPDGKLLELHPISVGAPPVASCAHARQNVERFIVVERHLLLCPEIRKPRCRDSVASKNLSMSRRLGTDGLRKGRKLTENACLNTTGSEIMLHISRFTIANNLQILERVLKSLTSSHDLLAHSATMLEQLPGDKITRSRLRICVVVTLLFLSILQMREQWWAAKRSNSGMAELTGKF